jgi:nicotinamide mononucleotide (NMN) deamidase PncC
MDSASLSLRLLAGAADGIETHEVRRRVVARIHDTTTMVVLAVTGGGMAAVTDLLGVPGASRTVLEVQVPYAETALVELAGTLAGGTVSQLTAEAMARACLARARRLAPGHDRLIGVACTAALVSDRPKKGNHRAHLAVATSAGALHHQVVALEKGRLDRAGEDRVVADAILAMIAEASGLTPE